MKTWRPIPIEQFYKGHYGILIMWEALEATEEKSVPWYADEPIAVSKKVDMSGIYRSNFRPESKWEHLHLVAKAVGVESLPTDIKKAFRKVIKEIEKINEAQAS